MLGLSLEEVIRTREQDYKDTSNGYRCCCADTLLPGEILRLDEEIPVRGTVKKGIRSQ